MVSLLGQQEVQGHDGRVVGMPRLQPGIDVARGARHVVGVEPIDDEGGEFGVARPRVGGAVAELRERTGNRTADVDEEGISGNRCVRRDQHHRVGLVAVESA